MTTAIKTNFKVNSDNYNIGGYEGKVLDDDTRTLFQIKKGLKRMAFIINRTTGQVKISGPQYKDEVYYDDEVMSMDRARNIWTLLIGEGWTRSR